MIKKNGRRTFLLCVVVLIVIFIADIMIGAVHIPCSDIFATLLGKDIAKQSWAYIILHYRLPKAIVAVATGAALSVSGLLMQTLFRNPLAGPYVLGISSGSGLGVALMILGTQFIPAALAPYLATSYGIILASCLGAWSVLLLVIVATRYTTHVTTVLVMGIMFSYFLGAIVSALVYFSTAEELQKFTFWSMGNLGNLSWNKVILMTTFTTSGCLLSMTQIKSLNALWMGESYAQTMGISLRRAKISIIILTGMLTGAVTGFVGPISFVGLAVPQLTKLMLHQNRHAVLIPVTILLGAIVVLLCDVISQAFETPFPINVITSFVGGPVVIFFLLRQNRVNAT